MGQRHLRAGLLALAGFTVLLLTSEALRRGATSALQTAYIGSARHEQHSFLSSSSPRHKQNDNDGRICPTCNCSEIGSYLISPFNGQLPSIDYLNSPQATKRDFAQFMSHHLFVQGRADPIPVPDTSRIALSNRFITCPDELLSFSFAQLQLHLPTAYAFTRTSGHGRLGASEKRIRYLTRHADTFKEYYELVEREGYGDGKTAKDRQFLWIVIEDDDHINPEIAQWLASSDIRE